MLFLPWALASVPGLSAQVAWWLAWCGSWWIFAWVWSGRVGGIDSAVPWRQRILHPIFLMQGVFAGYGFVTAVFFWLDINGIAPPVVMATPVPGAWELAAEAQRYFVLAHASLAFGLVLGSRPPPRYPYILAWRGSLAGLLLGIAALAGLAGLGLGLVPGLGQVELVFSRLGMVAGAMSVGPSLAPTGRGWLPISVGFNGVLLALACASGWKEEVLVLMILVGLGTFPHYPRSTVLAWTVCFAASMVVLPVLSQAIRGEAWSGGKSKWEALDSGVETLMSSTSEDLTRGSWEFFTGRLSEAGLFMEYISSVEAGTPREGLAILRQSLLAPVPRVLWSGKPDLEKQVMQRPYAHGVISELSSVSAKPHPVVDAYLTGGALGIFTCFTCIGALGSLAFAFCSARFGGVFLGGVFFNGLFSILWRGNAFEFMAATLFWAFLIAFSLDQLFRSLGWTRK